MDDVILADRVLDELGSDPDVKVFAALEWGPITFVFGSRDTHGQPWGTMMFVMALEDQRGDIGETDHSRLQRFKERISEGSSTKGTAWYGVASTVETVVAISKGQRQLEPNDS